MSPALRLARDRLLRSVYHAFADAPRPERITKRVAVALDDEWFPSPERCAELRALDTEREWTDLTDAELEEYYSILIWLDADGFRFYLPAFLCYALRRYPGNIGLPGESAEWACMDPKRVDTLSPEQRTCARAFLEILHIGHEW